MALTLNHMVKILILEDCPERMQIFNMTLAGRHEIVHMETAASCIACLDSTTFDAIFLDHDLGGQQMVDTKDTNTGSEVVRHLIRGMGAWCGIPIIIHSGNSVAAKRMYDDLLNAGYRNVYLIPFPLLAKKYLYDPGFIV